MDQPEFIAPMLTEPEAAERLNVHTKKLKDWRRDHLGPPFFKYGTLVRYRREDLEQFIQGRLFKTEDRPVIVGEPHRGGDHG